MAITDVELAALTELLACLRTSAVLSDSGPCKALWNELKGRAVARAAEEEDPPGRFYSHYLVGVFADALSAEREDDEERYIKPGPHAPEMHGDVMVPRDCTFDSINEFVHHPEVPVDDLQAPLLGAGMNIDRLREALTPSPETKAAYSAEFKFSHDTLDEDGNPRSETHDVPWTVVKDIMAAILKRAGAEGARPPTWAELMSILDTHYPADIFDGSSGDPGPRLVRLVREIDEQAAEIANLKRLLGECLPCIPNAHGSWAQLAVEVRRASMSTRRGQRPRNDGNGTLTADDSGHPLTAGRQCGE